MLEPPRAVRAGSVAAKGCALELIDRGLPLLPAACAADVQEMTLHGRRRVDWRPPEFLEPLHRTRENGGDGEQSDRDGDRAPAESSRRSRLNGTARTSPYTSPVRRRTAVIRRAAVPASARAAGARGVSTRAGRSTSRASGYRACSADRRRDHRAPATAAQGDEEQKARQDDDETAARGGQVADGGDGRQRRHGERALDDSARRREREQSGTESATSIASPFQ